MIVQLPWFRAVTASITSATVMLCLALSLPACKSQQAAAADELEASVNALKGTDFGPGWDTAISTLRRLADPKTQPPVPPATAALASYWKDRAQLALFIAALVTEEQELFTKWLGVRGWKLEGKITDLVNFQSTVQEIAYDFDKLQRDKALSEAELAVATLLAQFARTTQGVFYRDKRQYIKGGQSLRKVPELAWMDDALAIRDLLVEVLRRPGPGLNANWQNVVLTVVARVCTEVTGQHINGVCTVATLGAAEEFCPADWEKQDKNQRIAGAVLLLTRCKSTEPGAETLRGMEAIRFYYDAAFDRLSTSAEVPAPVVAWAKANREAMAQAYAALEKELFMGMTQADLKAIDERRMIESLAPRTKKMPGPEGAGKAPSNRPKEGPMHLHEGHEGHDHGHEGHNH